MITIPFRLRFAARVIRERLTDVVRASTTAAKRLGYDSLKDKQMDVIISVVKGEDVFGVLPTGYGKSLCYACVFHNLYSIEKPSIVIVVSPLTAIMVDQVCDTIALMNDFYFVLLT